MPQLIQKYRTAESRFRSLVRRALARKLTDDEISVFVQLAFQQHLIRKPTPHEIDAFLNASSQGKTLIDIHQEITSSAELSLENEREREWFIRLIYQTYLGREADTEAIQIYGSALRDGMRFSEFVQIIDGSPERKTYARGSGVFEQISDGEFIVTMADILFQGRGPLAAEVEHWKAFLREEPKRRSELVLGSAANYLADQTKPKEAWDPHRCQIMGTSRMLTSEDWARRRDQLSKTRTIPVITDASRETKTFQHTGIYDVTAIASLYKGRRHIKSFLENITSQTSFDKSELIIIDADSPDGESEIITEFQKSFPNIIYKRINYRLGIYDAWNVGVEMARGKYITNTNLDDLRKVNSFELQSAALDEDPNADIVYQDFYYSMDDTLNFEDVASFNFKSELPIISRHNLLSFNSPHNAPMWRSDLHKELGPFDTSFLSAGDWEFWLRCLSAGKSFKKINTPHVVYFQNPDGISTRAGTRGVEEGNRILRRYSPQLISKYLRMSRTEFSEALGIDSSWDPATSYYNVLQSELVRMRPQEA